jgi:hypothetical protein
MYANFLVTAADVEKIYGGGVASKETKIYRGIRSRGQTDDGYS